MTKLTGSRISPVAHPRTTMLSLRYRRHSMICSLLLLLLTAEQSVQGFTTAPSPSQTYLSDVPSDFPSLVPTRTMESPASNTQQPTYRPSLRPTMRQSVSPSAEGSNSPSSRPTERPTEFPSVPPTEFPSVPPTERPSEPPTVPPSERRTELPTQRATALPTERPVADVTLRPTSPPTFPPSAQPSTRAPTFPPSTSTSNIPTVSLRATLRPSFVIDDRDSTPEPSPGFGGASPTRRPAPTRQPPTDQLPTARPPTPGGDDGGGGFGDAPIGAATLSPAPSEESDLDVNVDDGGGVSLTPEPITAPPTPIPVTSTPTVQASNIPTRMPSNSPTRSPSSQPTMTPSSKPTITGSSLPSGPPTGRPTGQPSPKPSMSPTASPSSGPTMAPSRPPTGKPSSSPTIADSTKPTPTPSGTPSVSPTVSPAPSRGPTVSPTSRPTSSPSRSPSTAPSASPSAMPSSAPSMAPSLPIQVKLVDVTMRLEPYTSDEVPRGQSIITWESVTADHILRAISSQGVTPQLDNLDIRTNVVGQAFPPPVEGNTGRRLQNNPEALIIKFDVAVSFQSVERDHDIPRYVFNSWAEASDRENYVMQLRTKDGVFAQVASVVINVEGFESTEPEPKDDGDGDGLGVAIIAGASVGAVALIILIGLIVMKRRANKSEMLNAQAQLSPDATSSRVAMSTEIMVEPQDDISTLGDPMFGPGGMLMGAPDKDEVTASVGDDYDYSKQYRQAFQAGSVASKTNVRDRFMSEEYTKASSAGLSKVGDNSLFADDSSFEQQFSEPEQRYDVVAPAGKLGMVIDTPNGGAPVVHAIKDTSVLAERVQVGDRLLSVDGEDCTGMTAMQVSKLISLKSEKPSRVLVFVRARANARAGS